VERIPIRVLDLDPLAAERGSPALVQFDNDRRLAPTLAVLLWPQGADGAVLRTLRPLLQYGDQGLQLAVLGAYLVLQPSMRANLVLVRRRTAADLLPLPFALVQHFLDLRQVAGCLLPDLLERDHPGQDPCPARHRAGQIDALHHGHPWAAAGAVSLPTAALDSQLELGTAQPKGVIPRSLRSTQPGAGHKVFGDVTLGPPDRPLQAVRVVTERQSVEFDLKEPVAPTLRRPQQHTGQRSHLVNEPQRIDPPIDVAARL